MVDEKTKARPAGRAAAVADRRQLVQPLIRSRAICPGPEAMAVMRVMVAANGLHGTERNGVRNAPSIAGESVAAASPGRLAFHPRGPVSAARQRRRGIGRIAFPHACE